MNARRSALAVLCILMVGLGVAWFAGRQSPADSSARPRSSDAVRLGPNPGQRVGDYLAALPAHLPPPGAAPRPALVQFANELTPGEVVRMLAGIRLTPDQVVFRVPLPGVQTALRFEQLPTVDMADWTAAMARRLSLAEQSAQRAALRESSAVTGRQARLARYEAGALVGNRPSVLAVLVVGDRSTLINLSSRPGVRAVDAAPEGTSVDEVALAPLLPEQVDVVGPMPDDGPIPGP